MNKADLQFLHSNLIMERFLSEDPFRKVAQEKDGGFFGKIQKDVGQLLANSKEHPIESILGFIGPGFAWMFGFKKIALAMTLAEALGFNFEHFYASIREKLKPLLEGMEKGEPADSSQVQSIVQESGEEAMTGQPDVGKLQDVVMESDASLNNMLFMHKIAQRYKKDPALMSAIEKLISTGTGNKFRRGMLGFLIRVFSWLITAVVVAAGFKLIGKGASHILGTDKAKQEEGSTTSTDSASISEEKDTGPTSQVKLFLNPNASPELSTTTFNDESHVWLLHMNINQLHDQLIKWAQELYPQLTDKSAFDASSKFNNIMQMFKTRNKDVAGMEILAVPGGSNGFHSIREIVLSFAADVAAHTNNSNLRHAQRKL